jgi:hypothetical protein
MQEHQNERSQQIEVTTQSQPLTNYEGRRERNKLYLAESMDLVRRTLSLSNQPSLTERELALRATDWQDALEAEIPINRLQDAFSAALRGHATSFPVNAFEVLAAWREIAALEHSEKMLRAADERSARDRNLPFVPPPEGLLEKIAAFTGNKSL